MQPWLLFLTITLEGYVVLAAELLAIRQLTPYVGSSTDTISIIIAAVLLPLAIGYHAGGRTLFKPSESAKLRLTLARNLLIAGAILSVGFIHIHIGLFFEALDSWGLTHRLARTVLYCALFLVYPTYLLGQTIPLASQAFPPGNLARLTGRMLFYSTLGSFMGSIVSTIILMAWLGVHNTFTITLTLLMLLVILLTQKPKHPFMFAAIALLAYTAYMNSNAILSQLHIVQNNAYSQVAIENHPDGSRILNANNSQSSFLSPHEPTAFPYVRLIEEVVIKRLPPTHPSRILVIGAGGFTLGLNDPVNQYVYLDIDSQLKETSEKYFLGRKLGPNKTFVSESVRSYLRAHPQPFDVIVLDAYSNRYTIPADLITREFFKEIKGRLTPNGVLAANIITSPTFNTSFSRAIDITFRSVYPFISRLVLFPNAPDAPGDVANVIYLYYNQPDIVPQRSPRPYSDLLNRYFLHH